MKNFTQVVFIIFTFVSISAFAQYTPSYLHPTQPDQDTDLVIDYYDIDDDQDGLTDVAEGCNNFDILGTIEVDASGPTLLSGSSYALTGTTVTYTHTLSDFEVVESEYLSASHGWGIKVREDSGSAVGDFIVTLSNPIENLFFKLVDFDQDESWTVDVYDDTNTLIPLVDGNADGVYMRGQQVEQLPGHIFHDSSAGSGPNPTDDAKFDVLNAVYFYFPNKLVSRIEFHIDHPTNGAMRFIGMQYCQTDTDGDGINNHEDSDSDNDAIPDLVEAGGADYDGNGIVDSTTDGDNDGLADIFDSLLTSLSETGDCSGTNLNYNHIINFNTGTTDAGSVTIEYCITGDYDTGSGNPSKQERFNLWIEGNDMGEVTPAATADCVEVCGTILISGPADMAIWNAANDDGIVQLTFIPNNNVEDDGGANSCSANYSCLGAVDAYIFYDEATYTSASSIPDYDSDGDGVVNRLDLDADNDGIVDLREAGQADADGNGMIDGFTDSNSDGYHDTFDGAGSQLITGSDGDGDGLPDSYPNDNPDSNGFPNFMDIDSDDDGITDNTEAQATGAYVTYGTTDTDGDGIANVFDASGSFGGAGLTPVDTDADGTPDYLDTNSDDAEEIDSIEGHDTNGDGVINGSDSPNADTGLFAGTDSDNDGLDDGFDNNDATFDATNTSLKATSHPIFDGGSDRDWRSSAGSLDFDGVDDHVDYGDELDLTGSFSLEAWVLQEQTVTTGTIISKGNIKSTDKKGYHLTLQNSFPNLTWHNSGGILKINITSPYDISNNRWYHIAATFDGSTAKLFIDGIEVGSGSSSGPPGDMTEKCIIGAAYDSDTPTVPKNYFDGYIDEVRVWNTALSAQQMHEMMNQEIEQNGTAVRGKIIPIDISGGLLWNSLQGYYDMNDDDANDKSSNARNGSPKNITSLQLQTAPLPYTSIADGTWNDTSVSTPWTYGNTVWDYPNAMGIDGTTAIDWNIVQTSHNITSADSNITVLGLISDSTGKKLTITNPNETQDETNSGNGLRVTHYLKLDGNIDLIGESQLVQDQGSILDVTSAGTLERDQQGTKDLYTYNYWSSPVGVSNITTNNNSYTLPGIFKDGTNTALPVSINFLTSGYNGSSGAPIGIADYWVWKYANQIGNDYPSWQHVRSTGTLNAGEGYTLKGVADTDGAITQKQNYVFNGKPNNGDISLTVTAGNDYLVGNPYASAIDANEFILDNISDSGGRAASNIFNGALYFWDHFASSTHVLREYQGGYATYTLMGATAAISNDSRINATGATGTKIPERYIPVSQGFFVSTLLDAGLAGTVSPVTGGTILFKNNQRVFKRELVSGANTGSVFLRSNSTSSEAKTSQAGIDSRSKIRLMYDSAEGYHRQLLVGVDQNTSNEFDLGYDAPLIDSNNEDMYWYFNDNKFNIQAVNNFNTTQILPLGIKTNIKGLVTIRIEALENMNSNTTIFIHDKELNVYHDLKSSNYETLLLIGEYLDRFEITFSNNVTLSDTDNKFESLDTYFSNASESIVIINPMQRDIKSVALFNMLGQSIYSSKEIPNSDYSEFKTKNISRGIYIIKLETETGIVSKKVLVE